MQPMDLPQLPQWRLIVWIQCNPTTTNPRPQAHNHPPPTTTEWPACKVTSQCQKGICQRDGFSPYSGPTLDTNSSPTITKKPSSFLESWLATVRITHKQEQDHFNTATLTWQRTNRLKLTT